MNKVTDDKLRVDGAPAARALVLRSWWRHSGRLRGAACTGRCCRISGQRGGAESNTPGSSPVDCCCCCCCVISWQQLSPHTHTHTHSTLCT